jgi:hypothetical protein
MYMLTSFTNKILWGVILIKHASYRWKYQSTSKVRLRFPCREGSADDVAGNSIASNRLARHASRDKTGLASFSGYMRCFLAGPSFLELFISHDGPPRVDCTVHRDRFNGEER